MMLDDQIHYKIKQFGNVMHFYRFMLMIIYNESIFNKSFKLIFHLNLITFANELKKRNVFKTFFSNLP